MLSAELYFLEIGPVHQKLSPFYMYDAENVEFKFSQIKRHLNAAIIFNFDQYEGSSFQVFLQSDQAGCDNSAQKLKIETMLL